jgi:uncharacterized protein YfiM (DUF2279 family)
MLRLALVLAVLALPVRAFAQDDWLGPDKALHFEVSAVLAQTTYGASSFLLRRPRDRALAAAGFTIGLGAAKELYDLTGRGDPSFKDLAWDAAGTAIGVAIALALDEIFRDQPRALSALHLGR